MRILSILAYSPPAPNYGGSERQMHSLHRGLISKGVDIQVLADRFWVGSPYQVWDGVPVWGTTFPVLNRYPFSPRNIKSWINWERLLRLVKNKIAPVDLIQVTPFREPALFGHWLSNYLNVPWVVRMACSGSYGDFNYMSKNWLTKRLLLELVHSCSAVVVLEDETHREALNNGIAKDKIVLIANGLALEKIPSVENVETIPEEGIMIYIGRIANQKRIDTLIKAYSICKWLSIGDKNIILPRLNVVGGGELDSLKKIVENLGIRGDVVFCGQQSNPEQYLSKAICLINPSESEGLPNAVIEACAWGVPVILSDIPVHRRIASEIEMENFLFPIGNEQVLADRLLEFLQMPREEMIRHRIRCAQYGQRFSSEERDRTYLALYEKVLNEDRVFSDPSGKRR